MATTSEEGWRKEFYCCSHCGSVTKYRSIWMWMLVYVPNVSCQRQMKKTLDGRQARRDTVWTVLVLVDLTNWKTSLLHLAITHVHRQIDRKRPPVSKRAILILKPQLMMTEDHVQRSCARRQSRRLGGKLYGRGRRSQTNSSSLTWRK